MRFVSKIGTCNFCDFIFCDFTPWQSEFYSLDDMKKLRVNLKHSAFYGCEFKLSFCSIKHIDQAETPVSCPCEQKLIGPEITQAVGIELRLNVVSL